MKLAHVRSRFEADSPRNGQAVENNPNQIKAAANQLQARQQGAPWGQTARTSAHFTERATSTRTGRFAYAPGLGYWGPRSAGSPAIDVDTRGEAAKGGTSARWKESRLT